VGGGGGGGGGGGRAGVFIWHGKQRGRHGGGDTAALQPCQNLISTAQKLRFLRKLRLNYVKLTL